MIALAVRIRSVNGKWIFALFFVFVGWCLVSLMGK